VPNGYDLNNEELACYRGTGQRPEDFEAFWQGIVADLPDATNVEWRQADFQIPGFEMLELRFRGHDGSTIQARAMLPQAEDGKPCPVAFNFHGYSASGAAWGDMLAMGAYGYACIAMDCRGQGGQSNDAAAYPGWGVSGYLTRGITAGPRQSYYARVYQDMVQLVRLTQADGRFDPACMATVGGSQGGGLAIVCAALCPEIAFTAAAYPFMSDFQRVYEMDMARDAYDDLAIWLKRFSPTGTRHAELFAALAYLDVQHFAPMVHNPVLFASSLRDRICPPSTQYAVFNKLAGPKHLIAYPEHGHEELPGFWDQVHRQLSALKMGPLNLKTS
jgi:cephalosporin-C deacetylase